MKLFQSSDQPGKLGWLRRLLRVVRPQTVSGQSSSQWWPSGPQLAQLPRYLSPTERWILRFASLVVVLGVVVLGVRLYQRHVVVLPKSGGSYTEGVVGSPKFLNPVLAFSNDVDLDLTQLLYRGLYTVNEQGEVMGDLAAHEEISEDKKTYIIALRHGATWHDGEPITANDVVFTFERILDPESSSPLYKTFKDVHVDFVDDYTIRMTLSQPYAPFLSTLTVGILPSHIWGDIPPSNAPLAEYNIKPVGSGPFAFHSLTKDRNGIIKAYVLRRFEGFYGATPYLDELVFRFYPTLPEAVEAFQKKQVQGLSFITNEIRESVTRSSARFQELQLPQYTAVFFNQRNALLKEKVIRQSLERGISKQNIIDQALQGAGVPIHTPILPGFLGHNPAVQGLAFNQEEAKKTLDDAGWTWLEGNDVRKKGDRELRFRLSTVDRPEYIATANILKESWAAIGIQVDINLYSSNDILKKVIKTRDYEALLFGEIVGIDPDPYPFWHSSQSFDPGLNLAIFFNRQVDQLIEEARQTDDPEQRRLKYLHFQNILADEQPAIFLYNPSYIYLLPSSIKGYARNRITTPSDRLNGVEEWYIKTRRAWQ